MTTRRSAGRPTRTPRTGSANGNGSGGPGGGRARSGGIGGSGGTGGAVRFSPPAPDRGRRGFPALVATVALLALVFGVPAVLFLLDGPVPFPTAMPDWGNLVHTLDISQILGVLVVVVWLAWLQFLLCVVVEVAAALRGGVLAVPIPFSGPSQRLARLLVASVLLAGTVVGQVTIAQAAVNPAALNTARGTQAVASAPLSQSQANHDLQTFAQPASAESSLQAGADRTQADLATGTRLATAVATGQHTAIDKSEQALDGRKVYVVETLSGRHHESLWSIAERHLGDGRRYQEVYRLNEGRVQPDGRTLHLARLIQPGWRLVMPEDAIGVPRYVADRSAPADPGTSGPTTSPRSSASGSSGSASSGSGSSGSTSSGSATPTSAPSALPPVPVRSERYGASAQPQHESTRTDAPQPSPDRIAASHPAAAPAPAPVTGRSGQPGRSGQSAHVVAPPAVGYAPGVASPPALDAETPPMGTLQPGRRNAPISIPGISLPVAQVPGVSLPGGSAPAGSAPAGSAPAGSAPAGAAAGASAPAVPSPAVPSPAVPSQPAQDPVVPSPGDPTPADTPANNGPIARPTTQRGEATSPPGGALETVSPAPAPGAGSELLGINPLGAELMSAGLLAAALLLTLLVIRRRRGSTSEADPEDVDTEVWLRAGADADRGALLDLALRSLARSCRDVGRQLPQAYGAVVDDDGLDLLLTMAHPSPPPPWLATDEGLRWRVTYADAQHLVPDGESAYPLLASVGRDPQGRDALVNLGAAAGPVAVIGSPAMAAAVVRALALGLAGNPWSRGIEVLTCDLPPMLPAIAAGRLVPCAGARDLTEQLEQGSGRMPRTGPIQILTGGPAPGSRPEQVAIYGAPLNAPIAQRLQALVVRRTELAVVVTGELPGAAWRFKVDDAGNLSCDELSLNVTANRLGDGSIERLHSLFIAATMVGPRPGLQPERTPDPAGLVETDDITWAQARARVAILGEVEVRAPGMIEAGRLPLAGEIVAYLALHPAGVHPTVLASAIWPRGVTGDVRDGTLTQVRDWLGTDADGLPRLREGADGRLRLSPDVASDWDVLRTLTGRADHTGDPSRERDLLIRALHLVRGPVAGGITHGTYTWLPRTDLEHEAEDLIVDAADRLSRICAEEGDLVAVEQAAAAGLRAVPEAQHLWRHIIRAEHALGGPPRLARVTEHLQFALATSGVDLEPETQALIEHLSTVAATTAPPT